MTPDEQDDALLRLYRASARECPDAALDRHVLETARVLRARRRQMPVVFAAAAACLLAILFANPLGRRSVPAASMPDTRMLGLYEGRTAEILSDPEALRQMTIRQMPGGAN